MQGPQILLHSSRLHNKFSEIFRAVKFMAVCSGMSTKALAPNSRRCDKSGLRWYHASYGVFPLSALVAVRFVSVGKINRSRTAGDTKTESNSERCGSVRANEWRVCYVRFSLCTSGMSATPLALQIPTPSTSRMCISTNPAPFTRFRTIAPICDTCLSMGHISTRKSTS
jgi:hypothetical protein